MKFVKMHNCGNDYVFVKDSDLPDAVPIAELAVSVSRSHFGVCADGLVVWTESDVADIGMRIWNADGSEAEVCGNALLCTVKWLVETRGTSTRPVIETPQRRHESNATVTDSRVTAASVELGSVELLAVAPQRDDELQFSAILVGNPHAVIFVDDAMADSADARHEIVRSLHRHELFPNGVNVEFVTVRSDKDVDMQVIERGSGETLSCGSGACAVAAAGYLTQRTAPHINVTTKGGTVGVEWKSPPASTRVPSRQSIGGSMWLTGSPVEVFRGDLTELPATPQIARARSKQEHGVQGRTQ